jgi:hypothetical protein
MTWWKTARQEPRFSVWTTEFVLALRGSAAHIRASILLHGSDPPAAPDEHIVGALRQHGLSLAGVDLLEAKALLSLEVSLAPGARDQGVPEGPWRLVPALDAPVPCLRGEEALGRLWHAQKATCCPGFSLDDPEDVRVPTCPACCRWLQLHLYQTENP